MASPAYANNNTVLAIADLNIESWDESTNAGWDDAGSMVDDGNLYLQGNSCVSAQFTKDGLGTIIYNHGSAITVPTDGAILMWHLWASPPALATKALGGVRVLVGDSYGDFYAWNISGSDFAPAPLGGWAMYAIDPSLSVDYTVGSPTGSWSYFGTAVSATAQARGNPNAMDSISYGRCEQEYTNGDGTNGYAVFSGYALIDNNLTNRHGLLQEIEGGYKMRGLATFGTAGTLVDFRDENISIVLDNTEKVSANFHKFEVNNASSRVDWTAVSISALGIISKGRFEAIDNATINKISCTFTDMDSFIYQNNSTILTTIFRRCGLVTQGGAIFDKCTFDNPSGSIAVNSDALASIDDCVFNSDGTGYAVDLGNITTTVSMDWKNTESGYVTGSAGTDVGVTPTGNETLLCNVSSGEVLTVNVASGASTPSVANSGTGTVDVVAGLLPLTISVKDAQSGLGIPDANVMILREDTKAMIINGTTNGDGDYSESIASTYNTVAFIGWARQLDLLGIDYVQKDFSGTISTAGADINVSLEPR